MLSDPKHSAFLRENQAFGLSLESAPLTTPLLLHTGKAPTFHTERKKTNRNEGRVLWPRN